MRRIPPVLAAAGLVLAAALGLITSRSNTAGAASPALPAVLHADAARPGEPLHVTGRLENAPAAVKLQVRPWTTAADYAKVVADTMERIKSAMETAGVKYSVALQAQASA